MDLPKNIFDGFLAARMALLKLFLKVCLLPEWTCRNIFEGFLAARMDLSTFEAFLAAHMDLPKALLKVFLGTYCRWQQEPRPSLSLGPVLV